MADVIFIDDPCIYIQEETISAKVGDQIVVRAVVHSSSVDTVVMWYHEDSLINPTTDTHFSVSQEEGLSVLIISRLLESLMGKYEGMVIADGRKHSDAIQILQGMYVQVVSCTEGFSLSL